MFCHNCGSRLADDSAFCHNCGTKTAHSAAPESTQAAPVYVPAHHAVPAGDPFRAFVDNHVRKNTPFGSAAELLNSNVSLLKEWLWSIIPSVLVTIFGFVNLCDDPSFSDAPAAGLLLMAVGLGLFVFAVVSNVVYFFLWTKRAKCTKKFSGYFEGEVDIGELCAFLNEKLTYLSPYFQTWGILQQSACGTSEIMKMSLENAMSQKLQEARLSAAFNDKTNLVTVLYLRPDILDPASGRKEYFVDVKQSTAIGIPQFSTYTCVYKSAPILQAAVEYFLQHRGI